MLNDQISRAQELLTQSRRAIALTGAGISTPSGIPDFRSPGSGLWNNVDPFAVASIYGFRRRPEDFYQWIHPLTNLTIEAKPNAAHFALADLEAQGPLQGVITQNIDMLHSKAGSQNVYEVHGHMREVTCLSCYSVFPSESYLRTFVETGEMPCCDLCEGLIKPNVILYGEQMPVKVMNEAKRQARICDLMLVVGTSLETAPAGDLPMLAVESGARLVIVNQQATHMDPLADITIHADVVDVLPELAAPFLSR